MLEGLAVQTVVEWIATSSGSPDGKALEHCPSHRTGLHVGEQGQVA